MAQFGTPSFRFELLNEIIGCFLQLVLRNLQFAQTQEIQYSIKFCNNDMNVIASYIIELCATHAQDDTICSTFYFAYAPKPTHHPDRLLSGRLSCNRK